MSDKSKIEWTDATWNPIRGCSRVSEGCRNCYAERIAARFYEGLAKLIPVTRGEAKSNPPIMKIVAEPRWTGEVRFVDELLDQPLHWKRPRKIFVNSMSDLFHEKVLDMWIYKIFGIMRRCPQHTFQILTKRPDRMRDYMVSSHTGMHGRGVHEVTAAQGQIENGCCANIWLGVSVEDQKTADERIPLLLQTPAAVRWVSYEPALGPVDFRHIHYDGSVEIDALTGDHGVYRPLRGRGTKLDWMVAGGESGPGARPALPDWFRKVRTDCDRARVPFFFKQWGEWIPVDQWPRAAGYDEKKTFVGKKVEGALMLRVGKKKAGHVLDGRDWQEFPAVAANAAAMAGKPDEADTKGEVG